MNPHPGLFRRSIAFFIDLIIIDTILPTLLMRLGGPSLSSPLRYILIHLYFALFDSRILNWSTIGKEILGIQVLSANGRAPSIPQVGLRAIIASSPFWFVKVVPFGFTIGTWDQAVSHTLNFGFFFASVVACIYGASFGFLVFHPQKRGIHEILTETISLSQGAKLKVIPIGFASRPLLISLVVIILVGYSCFNGFSRMKATFGKLVSIGEPTQLKPVQSHYQE